MKNVKKYSKCYFMPPTTSTTWMQKQSVEGPPIWCSVDLRDGNQSLIIPMSLDEKIQFFVFLVKIGFKEIEVGFPAASDTEYQFVRRLIDDKLIPEDVTIQVLTQSRKHIIEKTFEAIEGAPRAVVHLYNSTSIAQREQVFKKSKQEIIDIAVSGAQIAKQCAKEKKGNFLFEYSPESFTGTEMDFALEICSHVLDVLQPSAKNKVIINLPATVEVSMPHVYASQVEYMSTHMKYREHVIISLHPHNDRGCAVAATEMGLLAGADRVEGTLFGNGERTGNVDIVTLALNMYAQGINPGLDFTNLPEVVDTYERLTDMPVYDRQPYAGRLVYAAFSGSHQDAIAKGMAYHKEKGITTWNVPYLPIDPADVGRQYDKDVIRINSQSGKGGIGYLLEKNYGFILPANMREDFGYKVKAVSDKLHKELVPQEILDIFMAEYIHIKGRLSLLNYETTGNGASRFSADVEMEMDATCYRAKGEGNGRLDAVSHAIKSALHLSYDISQYYEHALTKGSDSSAVAYVGITDENGKMHWGAGMDTDIITASVTALVSAINHM